MRILVIGGTGFIGRHVVRRLSEDHEVVTLHRGRSASPVEAIVADRDDPAELKQAFDRVHPDVTIDMIPYTEAQAKALVEASRDRTARLLVVSSGDVYRNYDGLRGKVSAEPDPVPLNEDAPLRETRYPYRGAGLDFEHAEDYDKILVEEAVSQVSATVLRLPAVFGPGDRQHRLRDDLQRMIDRRPAILLSDAMASWHWSRGYVEDIAAAIALAATDARAAGRTYNLGEEPTLTQRAWIERIGAGMGWEGRVLALPPEDLPPSLRYPYDWRYDLHTSSRRIRRELGFVENVSPDEAIRRSVEWELGQRSEWPAVDYSAEDEALSRSARSA